MAAHPPPPAQTELIIALVGAVGIDQAAVIQDLAAELSEFGYRTQDIHLTDQLSALDWDQELLEQPYDERIWSYMSAGNELRRHWRRDDAFALLAVNAITLFRKEQTGDVSRPLDRHAYIVRSLKRKEEAALLRDVYGSRFILLSLYAPEKARKRYLRRRIRQSRVLPFTGEPRYSAGELMKRDEAEPGKHGQDVRDIFHRGDFFINATQDLPAQLRRTLELLFGHPNRTPTRDEFGMFQATAAARRSAELGRQVGAAICTATGDVVALGTNEVPRAGGGLYWEGDPDDAREFTKGYDLSDRRQARIARVISKDLVKQGLVRDGVSRKKLRRLVEGTEIGNLIEFIRAVHAEMAALMDAARRGVAVKDTVLYVTTFPCHHCARHVVAAGISRVVYVAPYAKSLAGGLHDDSIVVDPDRPPRRRVAFQPFVGVGPRRYLDVFEMPPRKDRKTGKVLAFDPKTAMPRIAGIEPPEMQPELLPYIRREQRALDLLGDVQTERGPMLKGFPAPPDTFAA